MRAKMKKFLADCRAATAVEYGLIIAVLSLVIMAGIDNFGNEMQNMFGYVSGIITNSSK
jgi:pilus assembly protein Flp/PilA